MPTPPTAPFRTSKVCMYIHTYVCASTACITDSTVSTHDSTPSLPHWCVPLPPPLMWHTFLHVLLELPPPSIDCYIRQFKWPSSWQRGEFQRGKLPLQLQTNTITPPSIEAHSLAAHIRHTHTEQGGNLRTVAQTCPPPPSVSRHTSYGNISL